MGAEFAEKLVLVCREAFGGSTDLVGLRRLSGGANMESWALDYGERSMVLRRLPGGARLSGMDERLGAISLAAQAELIAAAGRAGVSAPEVLARLEPRHGLGEGFLMARVAGETLPHKILGKPEFARAEARLTQQCARELARIHSLDPATLPAELRFGTPLELVAKLERGYRALGAALPVFDFAFGWLERNAPPPVEPAVLHGDFRMGNLMIGPEGITAVLDWELAHLGDPAQDLAYLCTPSWRFGHYDKPVGGFDQIDALLAAYAAASGRAIEPGRLRYWLVFSSLWWGMVCLTMGELWRSREDRTLERAVVGRRVSEVAIDLLLLFDEELGLGHGEGRDLPWTPPAEPAAAGEIAYHELLAALGEWATGSVQPNAQGHALFEARVAANALGMARRQAAWGAQFAGEAAARLGALGRDAAGFCRALREGRLALDEEAPWTHLRLSALERIAIDQPGYAGLKRALARWTATATAHH